VVKNARNMDPMDQT
jgi:hypothetical protein